MFVYNSRFKIEMTAWENTCCRPQKLSRTFHNYVHSHQFSAENLFQQPHSKFGTTLKSSSYLKSLCTAAVTRARTCSAIKDGFIQDGTYSFSKLDITPAIENKHGFLDPAALLCKLKKSNLFQHYDIGLHSTELPVTHDLLTSSNDYAACRNSFPTCV